jgi:hypothetical protein
MVHSPLGMHRLWASHPSFGLWPDNGASEVTCTQGFCAYHQHRQSRFGSVLVNLMFTQNLVSIVFCSFNEVKGRFAFALDLIERAARCF